MNKSKVLIIDDDQDVSLLIKEALFSIGNINADYTTSAIDGLKILNHNEYEVILLDYSMPDIDGFEFIDHIIDKEFIKKTKIILITAYGNLNIGMQAINKGCWDYIEKPFNVNNLIFKVKSALECLRNNNEVEKENSSDKIASPMIGNSNEVLQIQKMILKIANKDTTILIEGETGTGKELLARCIHKNSDRNEDVFIPLNCGSLSESLLESELFGHEKGSFTGAEKKIGIFEEADQGTVFLDEINSASFKMQVKLLRFLDSNEFMRVGGSKIIKCNTRIIAASNKNLSDLSDKKEFRDDLYHRLNVVNIEIPPLRKRKEDIPILVNYFLKIYNEKFQKKLKIDVSSINYLKNYSWPGNIRELQNLIQSQVLLNENDIITFSDLPESIRRERSFKNNKFSFKKIKDKYISDVEVKCFKDILKETKGNVSKAARILQINRKTLIKKLQFYNINASKFK